MNRATCGVRRFEHQYFIKAILDERGMTMSELDRRLGVSVETVSATVRGKRHSPKVLDALKLGCVDNRYKFYYSCTKGENCATPPYAKR